MRAFGGTWLGYPKGVFLVAFTELWERFSYYGLVGLLVLYLTRSPLEGGFGWDNSEAVRLYGFYTGLIFCVPVLGGWLASTRWGERRCISTGAWLIIFGHILLGGPAYWPEIISRFSEADVTAILSSVEVPLGELFPDISTWEHLRQVAPDDAQYEMVRLAYVASAYSFSGGLASIIVGTAFIKPTISSIVSQFYERGDARMDAAFGVFWICLYLGIILGYLVAGSLGENVGWHYGFMAAGVGMAIGLLVYKAKEQDYLGDLGTLPGAASSPKQKGHLTRIERDRLWVLFAQSTFVVIYAVAFYQKGGVLNLYGREQTDRFILGYEIPATWLLAVNPIAFLLAVPSLEAVWRHLQQRGRYVSANAKMMLGLLMLGAGYVLMLFAVLEAGLDDVGKSHLLWLVVLYVCFGIGDALVWPVQMSLASKLAPERHRALAIGCWYVTIGIGTWLTGLAGPLAYSLGLIPFFGGFAVICIAAAAIVWLYRPIFERRSHGAERWAEVT